MLISPPPDWRTPLYDLVTDCGGRVRIMSNPRPENEATGDTLEGLETSWGKTREDGREGDRLGVADLLTRTTFLEYR